MLQLISRARARATYANVIATLALFVALGGTGYAAATLAPNSVGAKQIKQGAVRTSELRDRGVQLADISRSARTSLRGQRGPAGPAGAAFRAAISSGGIAVAGNATNSSHQGGTNVYSIEFGTDVSACIYSATLAAVQAGPQLEQPPAGRITVASGGTTRITVATYSADGSPIEAPFHVIASC